MSGTPGYHLSHGGCNSVRILSWRFGKDCRQDIAGLAEKHFVSMVYGDRKIDFSVTNG